MNNTIEIKVHPKETVYFVLRLVAALAGYVLLALMLVAFLASPNKMALLPLLFYVGLFVVYLFLRMGLLVGYLKGNAIKVSYRQFPEVFSMLKKQCEQLGMEMPDLYVLQSGGLLNAFATQLGGGKYIVIYTDVLEEFYKGNTEAVEFVLGHELGHIKRHHLTKRLLLFPSIIIPFLNRAYSRACEFTCDDIGASLAPQGAAKGLLLLAGGKELWKHVNSDEFIMQRTSETGFWHWFSEKVSTHPHLNKRLQRFPIIRHTAGRIPQSPIETITVEETTKDHSAYLPRN